ncbi:Uncharacterised protein [uncultured archaeon]|nr:Uncharacterised protein [uncultured archaeon]
MDVLAEELARYYGGLGLFFGGAIGMGLGMLKRSSINPLYVALGLAVLGGIIGAGYGIMSSKGKSY